MRTFRFRLASLKRIKRHRIEEKEQEIARLQAEIQRRLGEIHQSRERLADLRRVFLEETPEVHSIEVEYTEAAVRTYILSVEAAKHREIDQFRKEQQERRKELITLYQEEKMLERLRDRQLAAWQREAQREDIYLLDEMGGQAYLRRRQSSGGVMLVVLAAVALVAVAGAILVMQGKHKPILERIGFLKPPTTEAAALPEIPSATTTPGEYTIRDLYGDPTRPANEVLSNLLEIRNSLQAREQRVREREDRLKAEREALAQSEKRLAATISDVSAELERLKKARQQEQARLASQRALRVTEISNAIQRMSPKGAAGLLAEMWTSEPNVDEEQNGVVLDVFRSIPDSKRNKILDALVKSDKTETANMVLKFIESEPTSTPTPKPTS